MALKKKSKNNNVRAHVFYSGRVQGVGFRYTAEKIALDLKLFGWVKNLMDGRVEIVCEGPKETIDLLFQQIKESMLGPHIKKIDVNWEVATHEFDDFTVEHIL